MQPRRTVVALIVAGATLGSGTGALATTKPAPVTNASIVKLQHKLDLATAQAARTADAVLHAAAEAAAVRVTLDDVTAQAQQTRAQVAATTVTLYEHAPPEGLPDLEQLVIDPGAMQGLVAIGGSQIRSAADDPARRLGPVGQADRARRQLGQAAGRTGDQDRRGLRSAGPGACPDRHLAGRPAGAGEGRPDRQGQGGEGSRSGQAGRSSPPPRRHSTHSPARSAWPSAPASVRLAAPRSPGRSPCSTPSSPRAPTTRRATDRPGRP